MYAAVKAYYAGYDEIIRVLKAGGASSPTPKMKRTMTGKYLESVMLGVEPGTVARGSARIEGYAVGPQTPTRIPITGCENQSDLRFYDAKTDKELPTGESGLLVRELLAVKGKDGRWRISEETETTRFVEPEDWEEQACMATKERPA